MNFYRSRHLRLIATELYSRVTSNPNLSQHKGIFHAVELAAGMAARRPRCQAQSRSTPGTNVTQQFCLPAVLALIVAACVYRRAGPYIYGAMGVSLLPAAIHALCICCITIILCYTVFTPIQNFS